MTTEAFPTTYVLSEVGQSQIVKRGESVKVKSESGQSAFVTITNISSRFKAHYEEYDKQDSNLVKAENLSPFQQSGTSTFMQYDRWVRVYNRTTELTAGQPLPEGEPAILVGLHAV